mmetsp:Transcript_8543/g.12599  ORF Transcript_8543/g.12599 Transcript_8543/m.12599 type:complete len:357 (+) Transcript_8543:45-1115(+)
MENKIEEGIRIGTFNIRRDTLLDGPYDLWKQRKKTCYEIIETFDIVAVQDANKNQLNDIIEHLQIKDVIDNSEDETNEKKKLIEKKIYYESSTGEDDGEYLGIIYNTNKFECIDQGKFWLSEERMFPSKSWEATRERHVIWCKLKVKQNKDQEEEEEKTIDQIARTEFFIFTTHLDESERSRRMASITIREMMDKMLMTTWEEHEMDEIPIAFFVMGDFNCTNTSIVYDYFLKGHSPNETRKQRGSFHSNEGETDSDSDEDEDIDMIDTRTDYRTPTFTGYSEPKYNMDASTFRDCILPKTISGPRGTSEGTSTDFILVTKRAPIKLHECEVVETLTPEKRFPSTHRPIALTFSFK